MKIVIAECEVQYLGRLSAYLPQAKRMILLKEDGSISIHSDSGGYKPINWMTPPCHLKKSETEGIEKWVFTKPITKTENETLTILIHETFSEETHILGIDPGLTKDGVEAQLQKLLADNISTLGEKFELIRREYMTAIGPVDILCKDNSGTVAIEIKRRGEIDGVEQLTRYLELLNRDPLLAPVRGIFAAQSIKPQARTLAKDRGIECVILDYENLKGESENDFKLF